MDKMRWRYGDTNPVVAAVDSGTVIEIGDLLWQDVDDAKPASMLEIPPVVMGRGHNAGRPVSPPPNLTHDFANHFLGVAMQRSRNGDTTPIRVATTGVFEFDVLAGDCFELGNFIRLSMCNEAGLTNDLQNQQVTKVSESRYAIGRVAKREAKPVTEVLVDIRSTVMGVFRP